MKTDVKKAGCNVLTVDLGEALKKQLAQLANRNDRSMGAEARIAIAAHVKSAESLKQSAS